MRKFVEYRGKFRLGQEQQSAVLPLSFWELGETYQIKGSYWGAPCTISERLEYITLGRAGYSAIWVLCGMDSADLKTWGESCMTGGCPPEVTVHLCPVGCPKATVSQESLHRTHVAREETGVPWAGNLMKPAAELVGKSALETELAALSKPVDKPEIKLPEPPTVPKVDSKEWIRTGSQSFESGPPDPRESVRSILHHRKRKKKRSKKEGRGSSRKKSRKDTTDDSNEQISLENSSSDSSLDSQDSGHPFKEGHRVKQLARKHPGLPTDRALEEMSRLVQHVGEMSKQRVSPQYLKCLRLNGLPQGIPPAQRRELITLGTSADRLVQRDILSGLNILTQRIKAIELVAGAATWSVAQNLELVPLDMEKAKGFRQDWKVRRDTGKGKLWGAPEFKGNGEKGKKGDGKKGWGKWEKTPAPKTEPTKPSA